MSKVKPLQVLAGAPSFTELKRSLQGADLPGAVAGAESAGKAFADAFIAQLERRLASFGKGTFGAGTSLSPSPVTLGELVNEVLSDLTRLDRSDGYIYQVRHTFDLFKRGWANRPISSITTREIVKRVEQWRVAPATEKDRLGYIKMLFKTAVDRNYLQFNPAKALKAPAQRVKDASECIHTPAEARLALDTAVKQDVGTAKALAVRYFAGVRSCELYRMNPEIDIRLEQRLIEVRAANSKTRRRRIIRISDNLLVWLQLDGGIPGDLEKRFAKVWEASGVPRHQNVTRHSWCSYRLARCNDAALVALEAGHSEQMLFGIYREVVTPAAAVEYWGIVP